MSYGTGATAVGIKGRNYVVLAAERRVSYGGFVVSRSAKKVYKITDYLGIALAGLFADMQAIAKVIAAELSYHEITVGRRLSVKAAAKLLATILYSYKYFPFLSEVLVGGVEEDGRARLYVMDPVGSLIEDDYAAIGTGASIAIGLIESNYKIDMPLDKAKELAISAVKVAIERDVMSGDGIDILIIRSEDGATRIKEESIRV